MPLSHLNDRSAVRFTVLGPLSVQVHGGTVPLGAAKQQLVLALLLCRVNTVTSVDLLIDTLWADAAPRTSRKNIQVYVAGLRRLLGPVGAERIEFGLGGYRLSAGPDEVDALRFSALVTAGRRAAVEQGPVVAATLLGQALALWRGPALEGLAGQPLLTPYADQLNRLYPTAFEDWAQAEVAAGNAAEVVDRICETVGRYPLRERLRGVQMTALWQCGRQSEALAGYDELRQDLARELGLEPGAALQQVYRRVLAGEPPRSERPQPPPRARGPVLLPPDPVAFTGRAAELEALRSGLDRGSGQVAVISGPPGVGKTALAVRAAHLLAEKYPDGRVFVRLREENGQARTPEDVLTEVIRAVGIDRPAGPTQAGQSARVWQEWLRRRRFLMIVDGAGRRVPPPSGLLPTAGASAALITGRASARLATTGPAVELTGLTIQESLTLLGALIGAERVAGDRLAAEQIVLAAGLTPAAIRAAGLKLRRLRHLPLADFAGRLSDPSALLDQLSGAEIGLTEQIATGLADLTPAQLAAVRSLAALPTPGFTFAEAAHRLDADPATALRRLESLIEDDLVTSPVAEVSAHQARYELPALVYAYARPQCPAPPAAPVGAGGIAARGSGSAGQQQVAQGVEDLGPG
jgi:DNA-binding SARP family transcriptional activator